MNQAAENQVAKSEQNGRAATATTYLPDVDIIEARDHFSLLADIPGVSQEDVEVTVENNILSIRASATVVTPEGHTLVGREYGIGNYHRDFTLPDSVDTNGIKAKVQNGVLQLTIPKREEVKTRTIKIE